MRLKIIILSSALATALCAGLPETGRSETFDSGIFGVVPYQTQRVQTEQEYVRELLNELATRPDQNHKELQQTIDLREEALSEMKNQCVQAFDPKSELPAAYAGGGIGTTGFGSCVDGRRFPHGFMKLLATAPCREDGSFRLALAPGRYAVFLGQTNEWWHYVDVSRHQWLRMVTPMDDKPTSCTSDADCANKALQCKEIGRGQRTVHECILGWRRQPPAYDSGVRGRIGAPNAQCPGGALKAEPEVIENQCVEAFREGSAYVAACAGCQIGDGAFVLPLAPGRYILEIGSESHAVQVAAGRWSEVYAEGARPGPIHFPTCPNVP